MVALPACARTLRTKWTRQRYQDACSTPVTALRPLWLSEMTRFSLRRPRRASLRRKSVQSVSASLVPVALPITPRRPSVSTTTAILAAIGTMRPAWRTLT